MKQPYINRKKPEKEPIKKRPPFLVMGVRICLRLCLCLCLCLCPTAGLAGCVKSGESAGDGRQEEERLTVVATLFPQYDFARQIAGEYAQVVLLLPPGTESHSYDLRPADMITIKQCDMFIYTGKYMETWAQNIIDSLDGSVAVVDASEGISLVREEDYGVDGHTHDDGQEDGHDDEHDDEQGDRHDVGGAKHRHEYDPHIWTNPVYAAQMAENIAEALCAADPIHAAQYRENAEKYCAELKELDAAFREVAEAAKEAGQNTIYFGGRFAMTYFVREYGFDCVSAYHDCSAESEPSIGSVMKLIDEIKEHGAKAVYYEELVDPKVARTIAQETGTRLILLHSAHNVTKKEFEDGVAYLDIMWQNVANLKEGLCE